MTTMRDDSAPGASAPGAATPPHEACAVADAGDNLSGLLDGVLDTAMALTGADFGNVQLLDADGRLGIVAQRGFPDWWVAYWNTAANERGVCGRALAQGGRVIVDDVETSPFFIDNPGLETLRATGVRAVQSTPLRRRSGTVLGMLSTHYRRPGRPDARALQVLDLLADHAASLVERVRADQALRELDARYRAVVESSADGFWLVGADGRLLAVNDRYARRSGYSRAELLGMHISALEAVEDAETVRRHQATVLRQGADLFETLHRAKSGERWPVEVNVTCHPEAGGLVFAFVRDISERKRLETALRLSEERFRLAMEATEDGIWDWNVKTGAVYFSPGYAAMLGHAQEELEPHFRAWTSRLHPDEADAVIEKAERALAKQGKCTNTFRMRRKDGSYAWILAHGQVVERDAEGQAVRAIGTHRDITAARQDRQAVESARDLLEEAERIAHMGGFEHDVASDTTTWSGEHYRIYGLDPNGPTPSLLEILDQGAPAGKRPRPSAGFIATMHQRQEYERDFRIVLPDGRERWIRVRARPYFNEQDRLARYAGFSLDITEQKHRETILHKHTELIQALAQQQTAMQTAAAFAHELNQPLLAISAYSEVALRTLRGGKSLDQLAPLLESSHEQAQRAGQVLHDLIAHIHKGQAEPEPFDLNQLILDTVANQKLWQHRFHAELDLAPDLPPVRGNRLQTEKVLDNLIQNGSDAMEASRLPAGDFAIEIRTRADRGMAQVTVRDRGPGLGADQIAHLFEPFYSTKSKGLGLGLAISRALIEAQQGRLWAGPDAGPGAVFHFSLPLAHAQP